MFWVSNYRDSDNFLTEACPDRLIFIPFSATIKLICYDALELAFEQILSKYNQAGKGGSNVLLGISNGLVIGMGLGVVFFGLICIIILISIMGKVINLLVKDKPAEPVKAAPVMAPAPAASTNEIPNRPEFVAAVSAAIAEELGTDINKIQIVSIKKI